MESTVTFIIVYLIFLVGLHLATEFNRGKLRDRRVQELLDQSEEKSNKRRKLDRYV